MSDFFDNDNLLEESASSEENKNIKPKKVWIKILCYFLPLLILAGGLFGIVKLIPKKQDKSETPSDFTTKYGVLSLKSEDVKTVTITNSKGTIALYCEKEDSTTNWYVDGVKKEYISTSSVSTLVENAVLITATRKAENLSEETCGFDNPECTIEILKNDDSTVNVLIGKDALVGNECYVKLSNSDIIYLVDKDFKTTFDVDALSFASTEAIPAMTETEAISDYFENGTLTKCDSITVTGKKFPKTLSIVPNDNATYSDIIKYKTSSPEEHYADNLDDMFNLFKDGVPVMGAYAYGVNNLAKFNLDNPDISMTMKVKSKLLTYSFALQDDGNYAAWCNEGKLIYKVSSIYIDKIAKTKAEDYYYNAVFLASLDSVKTLKVSYEDKNFEFSVSRNKNEDSNDKFVIKLGKKKINCKSFQNFYQYLVSLPCYDFTKDNNLLNDDKITVSYTFNDGKQTKVDFVRFNDTKYQFYIDDKASGKVASTRINKLLKNVEKLASGKKIDEIN